MHALLLATLLSSTTTSAHAIALVSNDTDWPVRVTLNGLPLGAMDHLSYPKNFKGENYVLLPDMLLVKGKNTLAVTWRANEDIDLQYYKGNEIKFMELDSVEPQKLGKVLGTFKRTPDDVKNKTERKAQIEFEMTGDVPAWSWTTSKVIADGAETQKKLIAAAAAFAKEWSSGVLSSSSEKSLAEQEAAAKRAGLPRDPQIEKLKKLMKSKKIVARFRDDAARLQLLGGGRMARLVFVYGDDKPDWDDIRVYPLEFVGGAHDAPAGQMGPVDIMVDVWFRLDGDRFVPAAVFNIWDDVDRL